MGFRSYQHDKDLVSAQRIWREVGWIDSDDDAKAMEYFFADADALVATIDGEAECLVATTPGSIRYQNTDLDLSVLAAVTTSLLGRKKGFARNLTAQALANAAERGAAVSVLGMFEQGFYDLLGFGSGSYEHHLRFDPATLKVPATYRTPRRLTGDDWQDMHTAHVARKRSHGGVIVKSSALFRAETMWTSKPFGLGYRDDAGELTHFIWGSTKGEHGPFQIAAMAYRSTDELLELLKLIEVLGDQVRSVTVMEPSEIQMQDLLTYVVRQKIATKKSDHEYEHRSGTWWQIRMLDVPACVAARSYDGAPVRFVARISDPVESLLDSSWRGVGGDYTITIAESSIAAPGATDGLPVLEASVNAFTRMWFGVRSASSLAITDDLSGDESLLTELDAALAVPQPHPGMYF